MAMDSSRTMQQHAANGIQLPRKQTETAVLSQLHKFRQVKAKLPPTFKQMLPTTSAVLESLLTKAESDSKQ